MLVTIAFVAVAAMFLAKIAWNLLLPGWLVRQHHKAAAPDSEAAHGVSVMPIVELALLVVAILLSAIAGYDWPWSSAGVALFGFSLTVASHLFLFVLAAIARSSQRR